MPASWASSSRRNPAARRRRPTGIPTLSGVTRSRQRRSARPNSPRDVLLLGRGGTALDDTAEQAWGHGVNVHEIGCDFAPLSDVRDAASTVRNLIEGGHLGRLSALVANAGAMSTDTRLSSVDGCELTFAVNYLAHAQLVGDLLDSLADRARIVMVGSNTYHANVWRRLLHVPAAEWRDPIALAKPALGEDNPGMKVAGVAYSNAKLAILYYAHELQRRVGRRAGPHAWRGHSGEVPTGFPRAGLFA
ncbi:SDR family NAD(P)-dependent oxidoreductase [Monashia sp. NPDC004114]